MNDMHVKVKASVNQPGWAFSKVNMIQMSVDYVKRQGIVLAAYPAEVMSNGRVATVITAGEHAVLEVIPRLNRKKVDQWRQISQGELEARAGKPWDLVEKLCEKHGLEIDED